MTALGFIGIGMVITGLMGVVPNVKTSREMLEDRFPELKYYVW